MSKISINPCFVQITTNESSDRIPRKIGKSY